jgi:hypothetical protein
MNHPVNHSQIDHRFTALCERLIVFAEAAIFAKPRKGSLNKGCISTDRKGMIKDYRFDTARALPSISAETCLEFE